MLMASVWSATPLLICWTASGEAAESISFVSEHGARKEMSATVNSIRKNAIPRSRRALKDFACER